MSLLKMVNSLPMTVAAAAEGASGFDVTAVMTESVNSVQSQLFGVLAVVVPAIVVVVGAIVAVKFGISWIKKIKG